MVRKRASTSGSSVIVRRPNTTDMITVGQIGDDRRYQSWSSDGYGEETFQEIEEGRRSISWIRDLERDDKYLLASLSIIDA